MRPRSSICFFILFFLVVPVGCRAGGQSADLTGYLVAAAVGVFFIGLVFRRNINIATFVGGAYGGFLAALAPITGSRPWVLAATAFTASVCSWLVATKASAAKRKKIGGQWRKKKSGYYNRENPVEDDARGWESGEDSGNGDSVD